LLRKALKEYDNGGRNARIALIDPQKLDKRSIIHLKPYQRELARHRVYDDGKWHYSAVHEYNYTWDMIYDLLIVMQVPDLAQDTSLRNRVGVQAG
jgi:hypothetical protein